jgi:transcription antitermination factor NusG
MAYWTCAQLVPHQERLALHCLDRVAGFEVYAPRIRAPRAARCQDPRLLFPGYVFILIVLQWHAARRTPGVVRLVLDGGVPARAPKHRYITEMIYILTHNACQFFTKQLRKTLTPFPT